MNDNVQTNIRVLWAYFIKISMCFQKRVYCSALPSVNVWKMEKGTFKIQDSRVLTPCPLVCPSSFSSTPLPPEGTFVLAGTPPLPLNIYTWEIYRKEINNEYWYLWLNSTCLLRSHSGISIKWTPLLHEKSARFLEMSTL